MNTQTITGTDRDVARLKELPVDTPLYLAAIEHDGSNEKTEVKVTKFLLKEYEKGDNHTEVDLPSVDLVTVIDERFPKVPIKHQALASFHLDERTAVESLYEGIVHVEDIMSRYVVDRYGEDAMRAIRLRVLVD